MKMAEGAASKGASTSSPVGGGVCSSSATGLHLPTLNSQPIFQMSRFHYQRGSGSLNVRMVTIVVVEFTRTKNSAGNLLQRTDSS